MLAPGTPPPPLPSTGFVRLKIILQYIPVAASTWWKWVKEGRAPRPIKLGPQTTVWKAEEIHQFIAELGQEEAPA